MRNAWENGGRFFIFRGKRNGGAQLAVGGLVVGNGLNAEAPRRRIRGAIATDGASIHIDIKRRFTYRNFAATGLKKMCVVRPRFMPYPQIGSDQSLMKLIDLFCAPESSTVNLARCYNKLVRPPFRALSLIAILILLAVPSTYFLLPSCDPIHNVGDLNKPLPQDHPDRPFLFINMDPGYTPPQQRIMGVIVAIYPDGRIIRVTSESTVGESYIRGRLSPEHLAKARRILHDSGLLSTRGGDALVSDAATEQVGVRYGKLVSWWAHNPGLENTKLSGATNSSITRLKKELLALPIEDPKPEPPQEWSRWPTEFYKGDPSNF